MEVRKRKFSNAMVSYIKQRIPCKGYYRISIVLGIFVKEGERFEYDMCRRFFFETAKKSLFSKILVDDRGLNMSSIAKKLQLFCAIFFCRSYFCFHPFFKG